MFLIVTFALKVLMTTDVAAVFRYHSLSLQKEQK